VLAKEAALIHQIQEQVKQKVDAISSFAPVSTTSASADVLIPASITEAVEAVASTELVQIAMTPDQVEAVKALLAQKIPQ
jgi:hypothetical protein